MKINYSQNLLYLIVVGILFLVGAFFAVDHLTDAPPTWYDEGVNIQVPMNETLHGIYGLQIAPHVIVPGSSFITTGYPALLPISVVFTFFGIGLLQARLVMAFFILAAFAALFMFTRKLYGRVEACLALLLLVTLPPIYGNGKNVLGEIPGMFFLASFLYCLAQLEKKGFKGAWWYAGAGLAGGLCIATKPIFFILGVAVAVSIFLYRKAIVWRWNLIALGILAFIIPLFVWALLTFAQGATIGQALAFYANPSHITDPLGQIVKNALLFTQMSPLYFALIELVWAVAMLLRYRRKIAISLAEAVAFVFSLLLCIAFFHTYGDYRYFFPAEILGIAFLPNSLRILLREIKILKKFSWEILVAAIVFVLCCVQVYELFFGSFVSVYSASRATEQDEAFFAGISSSTTFFVYNVPEAAPFLPGENYYQYIGSGEYATSEFGASNLPLLSEGVPDMLIINGQDWNALATSTRNKYEMVTTLKKFMVAKRKSI